MEYGAIVLAGGAARRMGGQIKPLLSVAGTALLDRVIGAVPDARPLVVVGPAELRPHLPVGALLTSEEPPGSGPVPAIAAGLAVVPGAVERVLLLSADLPLLDRDSVGRLLDGLGEEASAKRVASAGDGPAGRLLDGLAAPPTGDPAGAVDVAVAVDEQGHRQYLVSAWRTSALRAALSSARGPAVRGLYEGIRAVEVPPPPGGSSWLDCDTPDDLRTAGELLRRDRD